MQLTENSIYEIEPPILMNGTWSVAGGMYSVCEYGMCIARCPTLELAMKIVDALEQKLEKEST